MSTSLIIVLSIVVAFVAYLVYVSYRMKNTPAVANHENIKVLNDSNFKQHVAGGITLVDFWAEWCAPCKMMAPILNEVASEVPEGVKIAKLNVDHAKHTAAKFNVRSIPTIIVFKNGKEVKRIVGVKQKGFLMKVIDELKS